MHQADRAHSATGTVASPGNIENHSATRRGMLTAFAALPAITLTVSGTTAAAHTVVATSYRTSPVMAAIAAEIAACERYGNLPRDLEFTNPALHAAEERELHLTWDRMIEAEPENWHDLIAQISHITEDGAYDLMEKHLSLILRRMRRLAA